MIVLKSTLFIFFLLGAGDIVVRFIALDSIVTRLSLGIYIAIFLLLYLGAYLVLEFSIILGSYLIYLGVYSPVFIPKLDAVVIDL